MLHFDAMPAWRTGGALGVKTVTIFPGNGAIGLPSVHAVYTLFSASTEGAFSPGELQGTLATLCLNPGAGRHTPHEITFFKSVGTALEDLAAAEQVLAAADNPLSSA